MDKLFCLKKMRGSNARAGGADIQGLGQFNELHAQSIGPPQEDRNLNADPLVLPGLGGGH